MHSFLAFLWNSKVQYTAFAYFVLVGFSVLFYYLLPKRLRWAVILVTNCIFLYWANDHGKKRVLVFLSSILVSYLFGLIIEKNHKSKISKIALCSGVILAGLPFFAARWNELVIRTIMNKSVVALIVPIGLSFYSLQIIAYLVDIYKGKIKAQKNIVKYFTFCTFFPQLIQGPIPRYDKLETQLEEGHKFDDREFVKGFMLIIWGFFLKYMIADKAGIFVDRVFEGYNLYSGAYILMAGILYSLQLYTDFMSCTVLSQGVAELYGIHLGENFNHPYFSTSIRDFWRRWHISFSSWLRDYIYISLGGNRKGKLRKYVNVGITFAVSGLWHGGNYKFIAWGILHAFYQVYEGLMDGLRSKVYNALKIYDNSRVKKTVKIIWTYFWVMLGWIIFRADSLMHGLSMIKRIFVSFDPWTFTGDRLLGLGLDWKDWITLILALFILLVVSYMQEKRTEGIRDRILRMSLPTRWIIYIAAISFIVIYGTYGMGFEAKDFIYGGF